MTFLLALLVFFSAMGIDWANTKYVKAVGANKANAAALWSVVQWCCSLVGFLVAFKVTLWMLPIEALGLIVGTKLSMDWAHVPRKIYLPVARLVRRK